MKLKTDNMIRAALALALSGAMIATAALAQGVAAGAAPGRREGAVIFVDDEPITSYALQQRTLWLTLSSGHRPTDEELAGLQQDALRALIDDTLEKHYLLQQERERKLSPGSLFAQDPEVEAYLTQVARENEMTLPVFLQRLQDAGLSRTTLREQARIAVSWQQWIGRFYGQRVKISDDEARARLQELTTEASQPQYQISEILIDAGKAGSMQAALDQANAIINQLRTRGGGAFGQLAYDYSSLPNAAKGGNTGWLTKDQLRPEVAAVIEQLRPGQVTLPIQMGNGIYLMMVQDKKAGSASIMVNLRQIAVPLAPGADAGQAQTRLLALKAQVKGCDTLDQTARAAGLQAADLGQLDTKDLAPQIKSVVETLQPNQVSDPIRTDAGLHLIAVCSRTPGGVKLPSLNEVKDQLFTNRMVNYAARELRNLHNTAIIREP